MVRAPVRLLAFTGALIPILAWAQAPNPRTPSPPNLLLDVSRAFVSAAVERSVDRTEPVNDVILKTRLTGTGHTVGRVGAALVPNEQAAEIDLVTTGTTNTETVGVNGPVQLYSDSTIPFQIHQRIYLRPEGASLDGACANADSHSVLNGMSTDLHCLLDRVVKKAACKKYRKNHEEADEIASRHAEQRLSAGAQSEAQPLLRDADQSLKKNLADLRDKGVGFTSLRFSSSSDAVMVRGTVAAPGQGTMAPPPALRKHPYLALRVHESMANETARVKYSGKTITGEDIEKSAKKLGPTEPGKQADDKEFSLTFAKDKPVEVAFTEQGIHAVLRVAEFTSGDNEYSGMNLTVKYKFKIAGDQLIAVRQGPIEAFPPSFKSSQKLSGRQQVMRTVLQKRFAKLFKPQFTLTDVELPKDLANAGPLVADYAATANGWLIVTWHKGGSPGNANLRIGAFTNANQEIGDPRSPETIDPD
jgi:hypothetical protein